MTMRHPTLRTMGGMLRTVRAFASTALAALVLATAPATAVELPPGAKPVKIPSFQGFCAIDASNTVDAVLFAMVKETQVEPFTVIDLHVDCGRLDLMQQLVEVPTINPFITIVMQTEADDRAMTVKLPRRVYLSAVETTLSGGQGKKTLEDASDVVEDRIRTFMDEMAQAGVDGITSPTIETLGVIARDDHAVYVASLQRYSADGVPMAEITMGGATLIKNHPVIVRLQRDYEDPSQIETMVDEVRTMVRALVAANEGEM